MRKNLALLFIILSAILVTACNKQVEEAVPENEEISVENEGTPETEEIIEEDVEVGIYPGMKAPNFISQDRDGNEISLSDYDGKIRFLNFWATTCPYCVDEMPDLEEFYNDHKDEDDFALIGINMTKTWEKMSKEEIVAWVDDMGITFPMAFDMDGDMAQEWQAYSLPVTFIIDEEGISHGAIMGKTDAKTLEKVLEKLRESK
ncbi:MAG: TlpA family protein disulfide reductase [Epulopiscium sp.]|nr:TlpA family protein disulfide reductase [Candidatus Epulonipiscium sp.]